MELEPTTFKAPPEKKETATDEARGAMCDLVTKGRGIIKITLTTSQYNLMMSALAGTLKAYPKALGTCKLLALDLNNQLINHYSGLSESLGRVNESIEADLDDKTHEEWVKTKDRKAKRKEDTGT
jgi:hypothetical protein